MMMRALVAAKAQARLPDEARRKLLAAIYDGQPFGGDVRDLGPTSNRSGGSPRPTRNGRPRWRAVMRIQNVLDAQIAYNKQRTRAPGFHVEVKRPNGT